jgi:hypothetical protein
VDFSSEDLTEDSTLTHAAIVHPLLSTDNIALAVFLDFKSAYDIAPMKVVREALLQRLVHSLMFCDTLFQLVVNSDLSEPILRTCGLPQGSVQLFLS